MAYFENNLLIGVIHHKKEVVRFNLRYENISCFLHLDEVGTIYVSRRMEIRDIDGCCEGGCS